MNGVHRVLEAALEYGGAPEEIRREFRADMGAELAIWMMESLEIVGWDGLCAEEAEDGGKLDLPEGFSLDRDPDLWLVRDERGDVVFGVSAETAMNESIESMARRYVEARQEIEDERLNEEVARG